MRSPSGGLGGGRRGRRPQRLAGARREPQRAASGRAARGACALCRFVEEHPLFLNRLGMASKVVTYHVPSDSVPPPPPPAVGVTKALEAPEDIPFLLGPSIPNWEDGGTVTALQTNLFMAPAVAHAPSRPGYTTFLLIRKAAKEEEAAKPEEAKRFTIREAPRPLAPPTAAHA